MTGIFGNDFGASGDLFSIGFFEVLGVCLGIFSLLAAHHHQIQAKEVFLHHRPESRKM
jgi:anthranilate/para-aminobenzoate synthase component II